MARPMPRLAAGDQRGLSREIHTFASAGRSIALRSRSTPAKSLTVIVGGARSMRFIKALKTPLGSELDDDLAAGS